MSAKPTEPSKQPTVFGLSINGGSMAEGLAFVFGRTSLTWIVTANPENLLEARRNPTYRQALKQADYLTVDGTGLQLMLGIVGQPTARVTGVELGERLIEEAAKHDWKVGFIGGATTIAEKTAQYWQRRYPGLRVVAEEGGRIALDGAGDAAEEEAMHRMVLAAPDILLVAFGGGTSKQESWIARRSADLPSLKVIVGVGGAFDFWTERIKRAPQVLQRIGLEWAWRLFQEPRRIGRILRATCVFPVLFLVDALKQPGEVRKKALYFITIVLRVLFVVAILLPALYQYLRFMFRVGIGRYHWALIDLIVPLMFFVVSYPIVRFFFHLQGILKTQR